MTGYIAILTIGIAIGIYAERSELTASLGALWDDFNDWRKG